MNPQEQKKKKERTTKKGTTVLIKKLEAILFLEGKYSHKKELAEKLSCSIEELDHAVLVLTDIYKKNGHAFCIEQNKNSLMLMINRNGIEDVIAPYEGIKKEGLSRTVLETLAIIAYSQPITKSEINSIRGVNSSNAISYLLEKNIIVVAGKRAIPGQPNEYITTPEFLTIFKLSSITELPALEEKDRALFVKTHTEGE